jgi:hypothetical protein
MLVKRGELPRSDLILLVFVLLREERLHILDEGTGDSGQREIERLASHALSSSTNPGGIIGGSIHDVECAVATSMPIKPRLVEKWDLLL